MHRAAEKGGGWEKTEARSRKTSPRLRSGETKKSPGFPEKPRLPHCAACFREGDAALQAPEAAGKAQPRPPSISSSMSLLSSKAYSMGSSFVKGWRNPWTMSWVASVSERPRLMR